MRTLLRLLIAGGLAVAIVGLVLISGRTATISAAALVQSIKDDGALLQPGQTLYSKWRVEQRVKPIHPERLADPYHLSIEADPTSFTMHRWSQRLGDGKVLWAVRSTANSGLILSAISFDGITVKHYDRASNLFVSSPAEQQPDKVVAPNPEIVGSEDTKWGAAWIVSLSSDLVTPNMGTDTPYYADLQPKTYERVAIVLKDSLRVVRWITQIHTLQGATVPIITQTLEESSIRQSAKADNAIFHLARPDGATDIEADMSNRTSSGDRVNPRASLSNIQTKARFKLILPDEKRAKIVLQEVLANVSPSTQVAPNKRVFDIQDAAANGEAIEIHYLSSDPQQASNCIETNNSCSKKTLVVVEGSTSILRQKMRQQRLLWDESKAIQLHLAGQDVSGYLATGGTLQEYNQVVFLAEVNDTFMFILGQHYTEEEFLQTLATME